MDRKDSISAFKAATTRRGSSVRLCTKYDPLDMAVKTGRLERVMEVFAEGYDLQGMGEGANALHTAFDNKHMDIVKYLVVSQKLNINTANHVGRTIFHKACHKLKENEHAGLQLISVLFDMSDVDVNKPQEEDGYTPIHIAAELGSVEGVKALIDRGANAVSKVELEDEFGEFPTPCDLAKRGDHKDVVELLESETDPELLELKAKKDRHMAKLAPNSKKIVNNQLSGPLSGEVKQVRKIEKIVIPDMTVCTNICRLPITEAQLQDEFGVLDVDDNGWITKDEFKKLYESFEDFGASGESVDAVLKQFNMMGDDRLSYDEYCILRLRVAQR